MSNYVIILSTAISNPTDLQHISQAIHGFMEISEWSIDLEDVDKILRVVCSSNIGAELVIQLALLGIYVRLLEIFNENGHSLSQNTGMIATSNL